VNCPGLVPKGRVTEDLVDFSDIMPTLAELTGADLPKNIKIDGRSFESTLQGKCDSKSKRKWIYSQLGSKRVLRDKKFKLYRDGRFYDVMADPMEENSLADKKDPEITAARARLKTILDSFPKDAKLPFQPRSSQKDTTVRQPVKISRPE
jgi:arylsulfatase A